MANDPFLEAGISIPDELPYKADETEHQRANSVKSVISKKHSVSLVSINKIKESMIGSNEAIPSPGTPRKYDSPKFMRENSQTSTVHPDLAAIRQNSLATNYYSPSLSRHSPYDTRKLDDLLEVDNEQDTVKSVTDLLKRSDETETMNQMNLKMNGYNNVAFIEDESNS